MSSPSEDWPALDLFRGLAAIAMIANHAAVAWAQPIEAHPGPHVAFAVGGLAPVLFFFATGFGSGLRAGGPAEHRYGFLRKVVVLCVADQLTTWAGGNHALRIDFLSFVAISMLVLEPLRASAQGPRVAAAAAAVVLAWRFGGAFVLAHRYGAWTGQEVVDWNSYPLPPWLAFPLLGFALGAGARRVRARLAETTPLVGLIGFGLVSCALGALLERAGLPLNRYGNMSAAYVPIAFGAIAIAGGIALTWERCGLGRAARFLSLRGLPSLLLVPLHFLAVHELGFATPPASAFAIALALTTGVSLVAARALGRFAVTASRGPSAVLLGRAVLAAAAGSAVVGWFSTPPATPVLVALLYGGSAAFCLLLVLPVAHPSRMP